MLSDRPLDFLYFILCGNNIYLPADAVFHHTACSSSLIKSPVRFETGHVTRRREELHDTQKVSSRKSFEWSLWSTEVMQQNIE